MRIYRTSLEIESLRATAEQCATAHLFRESTFCRTEWGDVLNSYCGLLSHGNNYNLAKRFFAEQAEFARYGIFDHNLRHYYGMESRGMVRRWAKRVWVSA